MLMTVVVVPESFSARHFSDPSYHLHTETLLRGIDANGIILVDKNKDIYNALCDAVISLASTTKGKTTHALFEELLKKERQKIVRFVATNCSSSPSATPEKICTTIAGRCRADSVITEPDSDPGLLAENVGSVRMVPMTEYITSVLEVERRRCFEALPSLDQMETGEFDRLIGGATKYSRWLRFYDKQIGKGTNLGGFRRGIEKILKLWISNAHFPKDELSAKLFTVLDDSPYKRYQPSEAYNRVECEVIKPLFNQFGVPITMHFKKDIKRICHARHLQTQSLALLFERGFDFLQDGGTFCRTFVKPDAACGTHLEDYRKLTEFTPATP